MLNVCKYWFFCFNTQSGFQIWKIETAMMFNLETSVSILYRITPTMYSLWSASIRVFLHFLTIYSHCQTILSNRIVVWWCNDSFSQNIKRRLDHCNKSKIEIWKFEVRGWIKNHTILTDTFYKKHVAFTLSNSKYEIIEWVKVSYKLVLLLRLSILKYWNNLSFLCHKVSNK